MTRLREAQALDVLQSELKKLGIESVCNFHVPGGQFEIDLYIPSLPRAAVEIKYVRIPEQMLRGVESVRRITEWGRHELGAAFVPILLVIRLPSESLDAAPSLPELPAGVESIVIDVDPDDAKTMILAASKIGDVFSRRRNEFVHAASAAAMVMGGMIPAMGIAASVLAGPGLLALLAAKAGTKRKRNRPERPGAAESSPSKAETAIPDPEALRIVTSQIDSILVAFRELAPEAHEVAAHELRFLIEEFRSGHFTACAMRGGRCLESMVYELSRRWGIELRDSTFGALNEVRKALDGLETALGDFEASEGSQREKLSKKLDTGLVELGRCTTSGVMAVKEAQASSATKKSANGGPRPVIALLKRIRSRYGKLEGVAKTLNEVLPAPGRESPVGRILHTRNRAAHAHLEGQPQEIDAETVTHLIDDINLVMLRLSNVGIAIQQSRLEA